MKYTVIIKDLSGQKISTHHYHHKSDAMLEVAYHISLGHQVEVMKYSVWFCRQEG